MVRCNRSIPISGEPCTRMLSWSIYLSYNFIDIFDTNSRAVGNNKNSSYANSFSFKPNRGIIDVISSPTLIAIRPYRFYRSEFAFASRSRVLIHFSCDNPDGWKIRFKFLLPKILNQQNKIRLNKILLRQEFNFKFIGKGHVSKLLLLILTWLDLCVQLYGWATNVVRSQTIANKEIVMNSNSVENIQWRSEKVLVNIPLDSNAVLEKCLAYVHR